MVSGGSTGLLVSGGVVGDVGISTAASVDSKEGGEAIGMSSNDIWDVLSEVSSLTSLCRSWSW